MKPPHSPKGAQITAVDTKISKPYFNQNRNNKGRSKTDHGKPPLPKNYIKKQLNESSINKHEDNDDNTINILKLHTVIPGIMFNFNERNSETFSRIDD